MNAFGQVTHRDTGYHVGHASLARVEQGPYASMTRTQVANSHITLGTNQSYGLAIRGIPFPPIG
jgi:hypothetical protein